MSSPPSPTPRSGLRRPRLLVDYVRLSAASRRRAPAPPPWAHAGDVLSLGDGLARIEAVLGPCAAGPARGRLLAALEGHGDDALPDPTCMAGNHALGATAYAVVRALRAEAVVETGVATGVASAFILAALADNDRGALHSVDLPPLAWVRAERVGVAVPAELRRRWHYHWGASSRLLEPVLRATRELRPRVFLHDSDHSYDNVRWELRTAWASLLPGDVLLCDDAHFHAGMADTAAALGATPWWIAQPGHHGVTGLIMR